MANNNFNLDNPIYFNSQNTAEFINRCDELGETIDRLILQIFSRLTDLFFIRRFLDKDYITTAITYTGSFHSVNFVNLLVSLFDFKITHFSYSDIQNLNKLNEIAKNDINKLNYVLHPPKLIQCSDINNFPDDF